jgi:hypothetical protein
MFKSALVLTLLSTSFTLNGQVFSDYDTNTDWKKYKTLPGWRRAIAY